MTLPRPGLTGGLPYVPYVPPGGPAAPPAPRPLPRPGLEPPAASQVSFLTVEEIAASLRVSKMTVYRLVHGGALSAIRVGRSFRVPRSSFDDYMRDAEGLER